ncbi:MAG: phosphatase PAP2 family protein [Clostridia bacterium]|nr:phosphatase PAP2 family protein [Clostridia bacterium]
MALTGQTFYLGFEPALMAFLQTHIPQGLITVISWFSMLGEALVMILVLGIFYWGLDKDKGQKIGLIVLTGITWNPMIKNLFLRRRPYFDHASVRILRVVEPEADAFDIQAQGYSFPSGHSTNAVSLYGALARYMRGRLFRVLAFVVPLLVGFSRVIVGAHYPTDVLAGYLLGLLALWLIPLLDRTIKSRPLFYGLILLSALPGLLYCRSEDYFSSLGMLVGLLLSIPFEKRVVQFSSTRHPLKIALRTIGGVLLFLALNTVCKMPFSSDFLASGSQAALYVRMLRYALVVFATLGLYPMVFAPCERILFSRAS